MRQKKWAESRDSTSQPAPFWWANHRSKAEVMRIVRKVFFGASTTNAFKTVNGTDSLPGEKKTKQKRQKNNNNKKPHDCGGTQVEVCQGLTGIVQLKVFFKR